MFIFYGWQTARELLAMVMLQCMRCYTPAAHRVEMARTRATIFFVPIFTVRRRYHLACTFCGAENSISQEDAERLAAAGSMPSFPQQPGAQPSFPQQPGAQPSFPQPQSAQPSFPQPQPAQPSFPQPQVAQPVAQPQRRSRFVL